MEFHPDNMILEFMQAWPRIYALVNLSALFRQWLVACSAQKLATSSTDGVLFSNVLLGACFNDILIEFQTPSPKEIHLKYRSHNDTHFVLVLICLSFNCLSFRVFSGDNRGFRVGSGEPGLSLGAVAGEIKCTHRLHLVDCHWHCLWIAPVHCRLHPQLLQHPLVATGVVLGRNM